jgi:hypothetical protein
LVRCINKLGLKGVRIVLWFQFFILVVYSGLSIKSTFGNDKIKSDFEAGRDGRPDQIFSVDAKQHLLHTAGQMDFDLFDKFGILPDLKISSK